MTHFVNDEKEKEPYINQKTLISIRTQTCQILRQVKIRVYKPNKSKTSFRSNNLHVFHKK